MPRSINDIEQMDEEELEEFDAEPTDEDLLSIEEEFKELLESDLYDPYEWVGFTDPYQDLEDIPEED